jgi:hypothetical protein
MNIQILSKVLTSHNVESFCTGNTLIIDKKEVIIHENFFVFQQKKYEYSYAYGLLLNLNRLGLLSFSLEELGYLVNEFRYFSANKPEKVQEQIRYTKQS